MSTDHTAVLSAALQEATRRGWRLSPNQVGMGFAGTVLREYDVSGSTGPRHVVELVDARPLRLGLFDLGGGDAVGWQSIEITPRMVGGRVAVYTEIFSREPSVSKLSAERYQHARDIADAGGFAYLGIRDGEAARLRLIIPANI